MTHGDDLPLHADGRKATWFELFFDLVFVVAVAQLSGAYAHHYDLGGALVFALAFLAMWWCWLGHTFHATRFDDDSGRRRGLGFLQVLAVR
jgi:low temperature requirement protein LtrA